MFTKDCFRTIDAFKAQTRRKNSIVETLELYTMCKESRQNEMQERYNQAVANVREMQQILSRAIIAPEDQQRVDELMR